MAKFLVTLTDEERCVLRKMVSSGKGAARKLLHGRILLQADASPEGMRYTDEAIAEALGVSLSTIHRVRQQFVEESFEAALSPQRPLRRPDNVTIKGRWNSMCSPWLVASHRGDTGVGPCVCWRIVWWSWDRWPMPRVKPCARH